MPLEMDFTKKINHLHKGTRLDATKNPVTVKICLSIEFLILFIGFPLVFHLVLKSVSPIPFLGVFSLATLVYLITSPGFDNKTLLNLKACCRQLPRILLIFTISGVVIFIYVSFKCPNYLFYCPKMHYSVWTNILWTYPLLAVYPQELIYRGFLFQRYGKLFGSEKRSIHASALVFSFGHIIYYHPYSLLFTLVGGYLFAYTYSKSRSLLAASVEHALYGCFLYTIGMGRFFFSGIEELLK